MTNDENMMHELTHFSLCSGIGGIDLAAEWAGFETIAQCEINDYASQVVAKNFKGVHNFDDIRTITNESARAAGIDTSNITVLSAGFPCQPYSLAGKGLGDGDSRDMWNEVARVIGELRPKWFIGENTPGLFSRQNQRYFARVVNDLSALGYSVTWGMWGACDVGAPHKRDRVFIVSYADSARKTKGHEKSNIAVGHSGEISNTAVKRCDQNAIFRGKPKKSLRQAGQWRVQAGRAESNGIRCRQTNTNDGREMPEYGSGEWWETEPDVGRVANGISARVDRLRCLGNAVVPAQCLPIFKAIAAYERRTNERD